MRNVMRNTMRNIVRKMLLSSVVLLLCAGTLLAQSTPSTTTPPAQTRPGRQGNCFQQAGLERSVMEQIRSIGRDTRSQIEGVCSNAALTPQQQNQQVREIREKAMQEREGLMTADQQKTVTACQQEKRANHPVGNGAHEGLLGGCGDMTRGSHPGVSSGGAAGNGAAGHEVGNAPPQNQSSPN
jgi:hypothetical protein